MEADSPNKNVPEKISALPSGELLRLWKMGDQQAASCIVDRYAVRLVALISTRLNQKYRDTSEPDDIVQSAFGSFFQAARLSRIQVSQSVSLWHLLATFAKRKMLRAIEKHSAVKRGGEFQRVEHDDWMLSWTKAPQPQQEITINELVGGLEEQLPVEMLQVLERTLAGMSNSEIAAELGVDARTVRRRMERLKAMLAPSDPIDSHRTKNVPFESKWLPQVKYNEFVLGRMVGAGGFGKVYKAALQTDDSRVVAVKFLRKSFWQDRAAKHRFLQEIEQAAKIEHHSVVRYSGWGESPQGGPYVVMDWIDGIPIARHPPVSPPDAIALLKQICVAMRTVHGSGVVHGDLTPNNILVNAENKIWITDFGFSQSTVRIASDTHSTFGSESILGGTIGFSAPEQISLAFGPIGTATDIYAIGGLAYWFLTGQPPHSNVTIQQGIADTIASNDVKTATLPANTEPKKRLKRIAGLALRKLIGGRPTSVSEFIDVLE